VLRLDAALHSVGKFTDRGQVFKFPDTNEFDVFVLVEFEVFVLVPIQLAWMDPKRAC
jgi:hypothetical protein